MKTRRHHNNAGRRQIQRGKTTDQVKAMARRLGIKYAEQPQPEPQPPENVPTENINSGVSKKIREK